MEYNIKNVIDITYCPNLPSTNFELLVELRKLVLGLIRPNNLRSLSFRKLWAH